MEDEKIRLKQLKEHQQIEEELEKQIEEARKLAMQEQIKQYNITVRYSIEKVFDIYWLLSCICGFAHDDSFGPHRPIQGPILWKI